MATINGTAANDVMNGTALDDVIDGGDGNDRINGGAGNDIIYGGKGNDTLTGDAGNDILFGGEGNDGFFGGGGNDTIYGEAGDDSLVGDGGDDMLYGGDGNDKLVGGVGNDTLDGGAGINTLDGGAGIDTVIINVASADINAALRSDMASLKSFMDQQLATAGSMAALSAQTAGPALTLSTLGLTLSNFEVAKIFVDGVETPISAFLNQAPTASASASIATDEDTAVAGQVIASDADGDALGYSLAQGPVHGSLALDAATGAYTYTPGANFNGSDSFQVKIADPAGAFTTQTVTVGVAAVNDAPVTAADVAISTSEDTAVTGRVFASDVDGDTPVFGSGTDPQHGTFDVNADTGVYTYTPNADFNGSDQFSIRVSDGHGGFTTQTVTVGVTAVNDAPVADASATIATDEDTAVSGQVVASDIDGDTLGYALAQGPAHGTVSIDAATGAYTYQAAANYSGADTFQVKVSDGHGGFASQQVDVAIGAVADAATLAAAAAIMTAGKTITGTAGNDVLTGTSGNDTISGGAGNDIIYGDGPAAPLTTDLHISAALTDTDGSESLSIRISGMPAGATLSAGSANPDGSWSLTAAQLAGLKITALAASDFDLTVTATSTEATGGSASTSANLHVSIANGTNNDVIDGGAGNDTIYGGLGNDTLSGGDGNDTLYGGDGNDTIVVGNKLGIDKYDGGAGFDTLDFSSSSIAVTVDLTAGTYKGWSVGTVTGFESVIGSANSDWIKGTQTDSVLYGGAGSDTINGGAGNDTLYGGTGDDKVYGGANNDKLYGEDGNDTLDGGSGDDVIYDGAGNDQVNGGDGNDYIYAGSGLDSYVGGSGFDTLDYSGATGPVDVDASKKTVIGFTSDSMSGIEKIVGTAFADTFKGGKDGNFFDGGAGNDTFRGMGGADTFTGGTGADTYNWFVKDVQKGTNYLGADTITDFAAGDKLNLHEFVKAFPTSPLDSVVKMTDSASGTMVSVKIGTSFLDLVKLDGVHETSASNMLAHGQILV